MTSGITPHERRVRENKARRQVISDLEALIRSSTGTVPAARVLAVFEQAFESWSVALKAARNILPASPEIPDEGANVVATGDETTPFLIH